MDTYVTKNYECFTLYSSTKLLSFVKKKERKKEEKLRKIMRDHSIYHEYFN